MFEIKPIENKAEQKEKCLLCNALYYEEDMAYGADSDGKFAAMSQFRLLSDRGRINTLKQIPGESDFELMFILGRATMNFIDLCGVHICEASPDSSDTSLLRALGFKEQPNGNYIADMTDMFSGCKNKKK